ncbi:hypothetical protein LXA43DRAFT_1167173 [Ganoderma leucocontextum]|nr:hypothetical protein LXA43DRAFT_1167173 [Ganoderma leucocontextum]
MSEYWISHKKYLCKYCNIYIADDAPSRRQHETGLKHKGNVERFVRGLYKAGEKRKQDLDEEKREIARIEKAANAAYAQDVSAGRSDSASSSRAGSSTPALRGGEKQSAAAPKPSSPFANYSTAESLGYTDPDAERAQAEAERRRTQGVAGEWEVVEVAPPPTAGPSGEGRKEREREQEQGEGAKVEGGAETDGTRAGEKRPAEVPLDDEDSRGWKLRRKVALVGLGDMYDPGALPIKLKAKKLEESGWASVSDDANGTSARAGLSLGGSEKPRWSARGWNKPGEASNPADKADGELTVDSEMKTEEDEPLGKLLDEPLPEGSSAPEVKTEVKAEEVKAETIEPAAPAGGSLFKKRKAPVGGGNRGGRRI